MIAQQAAELVTPAGRPGSSGASLASCTSCAGERRRAASPGRAASQRSIRPSSACGRRSRQDRRSAGSPGRAAPAARAGRARAPRPAGRAGAARAGMPWNSRWSSWPRAAGASSLRTGTASSAAAVGVGARWSAARSISVVSVSCPTAEISGIALAAAARTTTSSLNAQRSSSEPPPRATISTSGRGTSPPGAQPVEARRSRRRPARPRPRPAPAPARPARGAGSARRGDAGCRGSPRRSAR